MVEVKILVANEEMELIEGRLRKFLHTLGPDMLAGGESQKVRTATATRVFVSKLLTQIKLHQDRLKELDRQEKENRAKGKRGA